MALSVKWGKTSKERWNYATLKPTTPDRIADIQKRVTLTGTTQTITFSISRPCYIKLLSMTFNGESGGETEKSFTVDMYAQTTDSVTRLGSYSEVFEKYFTMPYGDAYVFLQPLKLVITFNKSQVNEVVDVALKIALY